LPLYGRWKSKPAPGTPIDWGHPLSQGLVFALPLWEGSGLSAQDIGPSILSLTLNSASAWASGGQGVGVDCTAVSAGGIATIGASLKIANPLTLAIALRWNGTNPTGVPLVFGLVTNNSTYTSAWRLQGFTGNSAIQLNGPGGNSGALATLVSGKDSVFVMTIDAAGSLNAYLDGVLQTGPIAAQGGSPAYGATNSGVYIGGSPGNATPQHRYYGAWIWRQALPRDAASAFSANPWQVYQQPHPYWLLKTPTAGGTVSGSMGVTLAPAVFSGTGSTGTAGSMGITLAPDVFSGTAGILSSGSMGVTLAPDVFAGSAAFATSATMAVTLGADTFVGTSGNITVASMAATLASGIFVGTATAAGAASSGSMDVTLAPDAFAGSAAGGGIVATTAAMSVTLAPDTFTATALAYGFGLTLVVTPDPRRGFTLHANLPDPGRADWWTYGGGED
jgi:hypothetical protein